VLPPTDKVMSAKRHPIFDADIFSQAVWHICMQPRDVK